MLPFRDLFTYRIALRLAEDSHVDMVLGDGRSIGERARHLIPATPASGSCMSRALMNRSGFGSPTSGTTTSPTWANGARHLEPVVMPIG